MLTGLFKSASFGPSSNLHKRISLVEVYRFGQCLGWRSSPISTFFSLVSSRAFRDAPHSRFRCGDPNQCLPNFLKTQLLAFTQISLLEVYRFGHCLKSMRPGYTQRDFDQIWGDFQSLGDISESQGLKANTMRLCFSVNWTEEKFLNAWL